ncbi:SPFH domain-containing protein [Laedolimicola ammoniilytica]|uniref:SPFH domain-containing protein n=1 Tax=Laedolimicola ammoniilytica TaxID=2981771 RepID=A0ABT2RWZ3_9FIRM|nr:SPFH domain-containing protein [Laedolimicola ammoniilytica]MCC2826104.1 SPFH domain-containing protein [Faecalicatena orotica]MCU6696803.1 SPFH domain-containing protein [Laedolimicola ammoniilytica]SCH22777.1 Putative virion core protein (lumpy skin disease virus) [uncultured Clostridium sp.]SCH91418.1 Putative virion core protein (lumpy skin disease virus) [uncultured Clostridium sp.]
MGLFSGQFANVVEWQEYRDDMLFWKWSNKEIKKGSRLIIRPGQDAIFLYNGKVEGIFRDEGSYDIESAIIPFLSTLKGFKFGFNSGLRAEVLFINTKEVLVKWGTKNPVLIPAPGLPGGMPIRAFGTFTCKVADYDALIEKVAGIKQQYSVEDVRERIISMLDQLLMKWIAKEGKDMFNLQVNADAIGRGIREDLDMEMSKIGISIASFAISSFNYPESVQKMAEKAAAQSMIGDVGRFQQVAMGEAMAKGNGGGTASDMAGMAMGMAMGQQMAAQMAQAMNGGAQTAGTAAGTGAPAGGGAAPNFCPNCGTKTNGANFCPNCGQKLV